jgi:hypothetical protein
MVANRPWARRLAIALDGGACNVLIESREADAHPIEPWTLTCRVIKDYSGGGEVARSTNQRTMQRTMPGTMVSALCVLICATGMTAHATVDSPDARSAEDLVLTVYFEGMPPERAHELTAAGAQHLIELLRSGDHQPFHSNIVIALGINGHPQAFETLQWYGRDEPGDVASGVYRGRVAVPVAMGHLALGDDRALDWLITRARGMSATPRWKRAGSVTGALADTMRAQVLNGLAISRRRANSGSIG